MASKVLTSQRRRITDAHPKNKRHKDAEISLARLSLAPIASSAEHARSEYELVEQAMLALEGTNGLISPPLYGATSSPWDTDTIPNTDYDEWLKLLPDEWTLEHILQADQVIQTLLRVHKWGNRTETCKWAPALSRIARTISAVELDLALSEITRSVEIVRVRSIVDPNGRSVRDGYILHALSFYEACPKLMNLLFLADFQISVERGAIPGTKVASRDRRRAAN